MKKFQIDLTEDELIIFSDWLSRFNERAGEKFQDQAEQVVLWRIDGRLEKLNETLLSADYDKRLHEAYRRCQDRVE